MDVHSLTLGRTAEGDRYWRRPEDWPQWVKLVDIVQMNEGEAALLGAVATAPVDFLRDFGMRLLDLGPQSAVFTRGSEGVLAVYRDLRGRRQVSIPADRPERAVDSTGCGDVFLAALAAHFCTTGDFEPAIRYATKAASLSSRLRGTHSLQQLAQLRLD